MQIVFVFHQMHKLSCFRFLRISSVCITYIYLIRCPLEQTVFEKLLWLYFLNDKRRTNYVKSLRWIYTLKIHKNG
jgi:hypothetical protein